MITLMLIGVGLIFIGEVISIVMDFHFYDPFPGPFIMALGGVAAVVGFCGNLIVKVNS